MKTLYYFLAVFLAMVCALDNSEAENHKHFYECLTELGMLGMDLQDLESKPVSPCYDACMYEKIGIMAYGKILIDRYVENYMVSLKDKSKRKPEDIFLIRAKLLECASRANKEQNKCMVANVINTCEIENRKLLYP